MDKLLIFSNKVNQYITQDSGIIRIYNPGMKGLDGRGWPRIASREAPSSLNQRKK